MYIIISNRKALDLIFQNNGRKVFEFENNGAVAFKLSNDTFIISPQNGDSSMLFSNKGSYDQFIADPKFPNYGETLFGRYELAIRDSNLHVDRFYKILDNDLGIKTIRVNSVNDIDSLFKQLNKVFKEKKIDKHYIVPIGVIIGDVLSKTYGFYWKLERKSYQFESYTFPRLFEKHKIAFDSFWDSILNYHTKKQFSFVDFKKRVDHFLLTIELNFSE